MELAYEILESEAKQLIALRHMLHAQPELSDQEQHTAKVIADFLNSQCQPAELHTKVGGEGVLAVFDSFNPGPIIAFRCELDALPITEASGAPYSSKKTGIAHVCGHDGHMAIACGLGLRLAKKPPTKGKVLLVFQPAEETGEGAKRIVADERFQSMLPDRIYAFHGLPSLELGKAQVKEGVICNASQGVVVRLQGRAAHACAPEQGISPTKAAAELLFAIEQLSDTSMEGEKLLLATVVGAKLGKRAFGTTPGEAELYATLRSHSSKNLDKLKQAVCQVVELTASEHALNHEIYWSEEFVETMNNSECVEVIQKAAEPCGMPVSTFEKPLRWSEDFGVYTREIEGALCILGAGVQGQNVGLHDPRYDFPDTLIGPSVKLIEQIVRIELGED